MKTLDELWDEALTYGSPRLALLSRGHYCAIEFQCIQGVKLEAQSECGLKDPREALTQAIDKAKKICESYKPKTQHLQIKGE